MAGIDEYTKLLLHMDGDDDGTVFTDDSLSPHSISKYGDTVTKTGTKQFGTASAYFDGAGDYLHALDSDDWDFGTDLWTIDVWMNLNSSQQGSTAAGTIVSTVHFTSNLGWCLFFYKTNGNIHFYNNSTILTAGSDYRDDIWHHIAVVNDGSNIILYVDGEAIDSTSTIAVNSQNVGLSVGTFYANYPVGPTYDSTHHGYIDELRISKGIARWTSDFDPPTVPYSYPYEVAGNSSDDARIIITNESNREVEYDSVESAGAYSRGFIDQNERTVVAIKESDGEGIAYGRVIPSEK